MARARARIRLWLGIDIDREGYGLGYRLALPVCPFRPLEVTQKALKVKVLTLFILEVSRRLRHATPRPPLHSLSSLGLHSPTLSRPLLLACLLCVLSSETLNKLWSSSCQMKVSLAYCCFCCCCCSHCCCLFFVVVATVCFCNCCSQSEAMPAKAFIALHRWFSAYFRLVFSILIKLFIFFYFNARYDIN